MAQPDVPPNKLLALELSKIVVLLQEMGRGMQLAFGNRDGILPIPPMEGTYATFIISLGELMKILAAYANDLVKPESTINLGLHTKIATTLKTILAKMRTLKQQTPTLVNSAIWTKWEVQIIINVVLNLANLLVLKDEEFYGNPLPAIVLSSSPSNTSSNLNWNVVSMVGNVLGNKLTLY